MFCWLPTLIRNILTHARTHKPLALDVTGNDTKNKMKIKKTKTNDERFESTNIFLLLLICSPACAVSLSTLNSVVRSFVSDSYSNEKGWWCGGFARVFGPVGGEANTLRERAFVGFFVLLLKWYQDGRVRSSTGRDLHELLSPLFLQPDKKIKSKNQRSFFISFITKVSSRVYQMCSLSSHQDHHF